MNKMKNELTKNQIQATKLLNTLVEEGDFYMENCTHEESTNYAWMGEMLDLLTNNGWARKSAEGTIGSLLNIAYEEYDDEVNNETGQKETLYVVLMTEVA
tara:strand:- start:449 stop:748 length:300 start_codon:yes stop_codon:yes gene_type:complete